MNILNVNIIYIRKLQVKQWDITALKSKTLRTSNAGGEMEQQEISFLTSKDTNNKATLEDSSTAS